MKTLNSMFEKKIKKVPTHKKRIDAKMDIKVAVTNEEKSEIRRLNFILNRSQSITQFSSDLVKEGLDIAYIVHVPITNQPKDKEFIHVKLPFNYQEKIMNLSIEWGCSIRKAARRILINILEDKKGGN